MNMSTDLFTAIGTKNVASTAGGSLSVAMTTGYGNQVRVYNSGATAIAFVAFGDSTVTASTTASTPVGPGQIFGTSIDPTNQTYAAVISSVTGTTTIYFTKGNGN
jgi:ABC-type uncharacterized transport system permease subunit